MSSILKALKKVENDRATRQPDALKIDSDILRPDAPSSHSTAGIIVAAFLLIAGGAAATYLLTGRTVSPEKRAATAQLPAPSPQLPAQPTAKIPLETLPPAIMVVPAQESRSERVPQHPPKANKRAQASTSTPAGRDTSANRQRAVVHNIAATPTATVASETAPRPTLRVNGIAWQNSSADSMAIINGTAVSNGKVIEGVEVEEIQKDRVKFNFR